MQITCIVVLAAGDQPGWSTDEAASDVLTALGGDASKDSCTLQVTAPMATAGTPPAPPDPGTPA